MVLKGVSITSSAPSSPRLPPVATCPPAYTGDRSPRMPPVMVTAESCATGAAPAPAAAGTAARETVTALPFRS